MDGSLALMVIDVQNDFCPGGALPVPGGDQVVPPLNRVVAGFSARDLPVFASRDWHPEETDHFQQQGGLWPVQCVQGSSGAAFHPKLHLPENTIVLSKGIDPLADGYTAFEGVSWTGATLAESLETFGAQHLCIGGLATDYCVRATVFDALGRGCTVTVLTDAVAGVDIKPGDSQRALDEMCGRLGRGCSGLKTCFLNSPCRVDPAERTNRLAVLWRKRSFGSNFDNCCRWVERMLSLKQTGRLHNKSTFEVLVDAMTAHGQGHPPNISCLPFVADRHPVVGYNWSACRP